LVDNKFSKLLGIKREKIAKVSRETGISRSTLTNLYYNKSRAISFDVVEKLCCYFSCQIGDLLTLKNNSDLI